MTRNNTPSQFLFNQFQETPKTLRRQNFYCIYNDRDKYDSFMAAWVMDNILSKHSSKTFVTETEHDSIPRYPTGCLFLINVVYGIDRMIDLIETAQRTVIITNNVHTRLLLNTLSERYNEKKLAIVYTPMIPVVLTTIDCFKKPTPKTIESIIKLSRKEQQRFYYTLDNTPCNFSLLYRIEEKHDGDVTDVVNTGKTLEHTITREWFVIQQNLEERLGTLTTSGLEIPIIKVNQANLRKGIARRLGEHLNEPVVGITYPMGTNVGVYIYSISETTTARFIACSFGGSGTLTDGSFIIENVDHNEFYTYIT